MPMGRGSGLARSSLISRASGLRGLRSTPRRPLGARPRHLGWRPSIHPRTPQESKFRRAGRQASLPAVRSVGKPPTRNRRVGVPILWQDCLGRESSLLDQACPAGAECPRAGERSRAVASLSPWGAVRPLTHEQRLRRQLPRGWVGQVADKLMCGIGHGPQLAGFGLRGLGYQGQPAGRAICSSADDGRPAGTMAHRRCAVVRGGPQNPERFLSADRSEPLEVVIDPIDDRDPVEANSLLPRHVAVVIT
jgi:hypothetical protein